MISEVKLGAIFVHGSHSGDTLKMLASWPENAHENMTEKLHKLAEDVMVEQDTLNSKIKIYKDL